MHIHPTVFLLCLYFCACGPLCADWMADAARLKKDKAGLAPEVSARRWAMLAASLPETTDRRAARNQTHALLQAIPGPDAWPLLLQETGKMDIQPSRRSLALRSLIVMLHGTEAERWDAVLQLSQGGTPPAHLTESTLPQPGLRDWIGLVWSLFRGDPDPQTFEAFIPMDLSTTELHNFLLAQSSDPIRIEAGLRNRLIPDPSGFPSYSRIEVPDLITLLGPDKARSLLRDLLVSRSVLEFKSGQATRDLAREIALNEINRLQKAPWSLACHFDAGDLFLALDKKFSEKDDYHYQEAKLYHLYRLVIRGETDEAVRLTLDDQTRKPNVPEYYHSQIMDELERQGHAGEVYQFQRQLLDRMDPFPYWESFARLSARLGKQQELMELARKYADKPGSKGGFDSLKVLFDCSLAVNNIDQARASFDAAFQKAAGGNLSEDELGHFSAMATTWLAAARTSPFSESQKKTAIQQAKDLLALVKINDYRTSSFGQTLVDILVVEKRPKEAEGVVALLLDAVPAKRESFSSDTSVPPQLLLAAEFHSRRGHHARVLELLDRDPRWNASDLSQILHEKCPGTQTPLGHLAALALQAEQRPAEARAVVARMIREATPFDPTYELALSMFPPDELATMLGEGAASDRFEERPLIWKAEWLRREKRLEEALKVIREAVAIDPSDGEIGKGRRMTAYVIWGRIARDLGDQTTAQLMQQVEKAIRLAESGDELEKAGLTSRAIAAYEDSLKFFSDAYCIQSRLALRLSEEGRTREAILHYERAFELMPDSFGRMESHCFGCEGAFRGKIAESTAERVFTRLIAENPRKPQLHYLMGYLREQNKKHAESLRHYTQAIELDPDYLNAWKKIAELEDDTHVPASLRDQAAIRLLDLDPMTRHVKPKISRMSDLRLMWQSIESRRERLQPSVHALYSLPKSRKAETTPGAVDGEFPDWQWSFLSDYGPPPTHPEDALARHQAIRNLVLFLQ
jgi:tetratricopeptide (TPR) repeat protein